MSRRTANRLYVEEIDEVSSVDIPANQLGLIAIAKRAGDATMGEYFDAQGHPVDLDEVNVGERVFDEKGNSFVMQDGEQIDELIEQGLLDADDVIDVDGADESDTYEDDGYDEAGDREGELVGAVGKRGPLGATVARGRGAPAVNGGQRSQQRAGRNRSRLGEPGRVGKSAGQRVLEELRKALTDGDRDEIIAKAFDGITEANERAERAETLASQLAQHVQGQEYVELAKSFDGVPAAPTELASLLQKAAGTFSKRELATFERILEASTAAADFSELGYNGSSTGGGVFDEIQAMAHEVVGKAGGSLTSEQAIVALLETNPNAYDAYDVERYV